MMRPLRLLFISDVFPPLSYGSGWSTYHLARGLRARGHEIEIVVADPAARLIATTFDGFTVWRAEAEQRRFNPAIFAFTGLGPGRIVRKIVRRWQPDVVHAQHINSALVARRSAGGIPTVVTIRDHWPVCFYGTALAHERCPACLHGTRSACNIQRGSVDASSIAHLAKATAMRAMLAQRRRVLQSAAGVIAASDAIEEETRSVVGAEMIAVVPNTVDLTVATVDGTDIVPDAPPRFFLYAGKLSAHKGADLLPAIMRGIGDGGPPLLVLGDGEEAARLHGADPTGTRIRLLGRVPNAAVIALMRRAIALVTPARWPEPLSRTHLEALAAGCPIVATDTGGTREIVSHEVTGYLTAVEDVDAMVRHLSVLATDPALRERMSAASRERSAALFSPAAVTGRHVAVYEAAIARGEKQDSL